MASRRENLLRLHIDAATTGLDLSKDRGSNKETSLWDSDNVCRNNRGTLIKRPAFVTYNNQVIEPLPIDEGNSETLEVVVFSGDDWTEDDTGGDGTIASFVDGILTLSGSTPSGSSGETTQSLVFEEGDAYSELEETTLSFLVRAQGLTSDKYAKFQFASCENKQYEIAFNSDGLHVVTGLSEYTIIDDTEMLADGGCHRVTIEVASGLMSIFVNDIRKGIVDAYGVNTDSFYFKAFATSDADTPASGYVVWMSSIFMRDAVNITYAPNITAIETMSEPYGDLLTHNLYAAGSRFVWCDFKGSGMWRCILEKEFPNTNFVHFRNSLIVISFQEQGAGSEIIRLMNDGTYATLDTAPNCKFGVEYENRLWLSGDNNNPKRAYYSADRDPTTWVVPDDGLDETLDDMLTAGYFDVMSDKSTRITSLNNKFYGTLIIGTTNSSRAITGTGPHDFAQRILSGDVGAAGNQCGTNGVNDYMCLNQNGVASIVTTDKFGDLLSERRSFPVSTLFDVQSMTSKSVSQSALYRSILHYFQPMSIMLMAVPSAGRETPNKLYFCTFPDGEWFGPFDEECLCMSTIMTSLPTAEYLAIGTADGYVKIMSFSHPDTSSAKLSTGYLDGRSLDPALMSLTKSWKHLRVICNPTGNWPITVRWKSNSGAWNQDSRYTLSERPQSTVGLCQVGSAIASDRSERLVLEFPLDVRSTCLKIEITTDAPKLSVVGIDVDFHVSGYEKEN